jgi:hypothetical protein
MVRRAAYRRANSWASRAAKTAAASPSPGRHCVQGLDGGETAGGIESVVVGFLGHRFSPPPTAPRGTGAAFIQETSQQPGRTVAAEHPGRRSKASFNSTRPHEP